MFAIFESGGKQHRVAPGQLVVLEKVPGDTGDTVTFDKVMLVTRDDETVVGTPLVEGATVSGTVVEQFRGRKIRVFKKKRRKDFRRTQGHRQSHTRVRIDSIAG